MTLDEDVDSKTSLSQDEAAEGQVVGIDLRSGEPLNPEQEVKIILLSIWLPE